MKTVAVANTWDEAAAILADVGPVVSFAVAAHGIGVSYCRVQQLCEAGRLRCFAICGVYHVPFSDVEKERAYRMSQMRSEGAEAQASFAA